MSLSNTSEGMVMPVAPMGSYGANNSFGGFAGDGGWWILLLFIILFGGWGGYGNGYGNGGAGTIEVNNDMQRGFDQAAVTNSLGNISSALADGFAGAEVSRCNAQANLTGQISALALNQATNACDNRAAIADLKYVVSQENASDRTELQNSVRDVLEAIQNSTTQINDKLCQQEIDALKAENANLQTQINLAALQGSQAAQTAAIVADNAQQTAALISNLGEKAPIPAYVVANPNGCNCGYTYGCGA